MRLRMVLLCAAAVLLLPVSTGCSVYRYVSRPELWGMSLPESWEYDSLRHDGKSHSEARRIIRNSRQASLRSSPTDSATSETPAARQAAADAEQRPKSHGEKNIPGGPGT